MFSSIKNLAMSLALHRRRMRRFGVVLATVVTVSSATSDSRLLSTGVAAQARPAARALRFPRRVGGFSFGATLRGTLQACRSAGGQWLEDEHADGFLNYTCSVAPETLPAHPDTVVLSFLRGRLVGLSLLFAPERAVVFDDALRHRYGAPLAIPEHPGHGWTIEGGVIAMYPIEGGFRFDYASSRAIDAIEPARQSF